MAVYEYIFTFNVLMAWGFEGKMTMRSEADADVWNVKNLQKYAEYKYFTYQKDVYLMCYWEWERCFLSLGYIAEELLGGMFSVDFCLCGLIFMAINFMLGLYPRVSSALCLM